MHNKLKTQITVIPLIFLIKIIFRTLFCFQRRNRGKSRRERGEQIFHDKFMTLELSMLTEKQGLYGFSFPGQISRENHWCSVNSCKMKFTLQIQTNIALENNFLEVIALGQQTSSFSGFEDLHLSNTRITSKGNDWSWVSVQFIPIYSMGSFICNFKCESYQVLCPGLHIGQLAEQSGSDELSHN